ncbi:hypothetical protein EVAR_66141_1 [Eumeta japonica]|uniref:Uncharacterized protein n=1 Tax=Eumeta variegata TaxID=151549 RepID=A0A4C1YZA9_EUMVA|nr:hypothetical protein EVAR_66141_1 [Eumeta japonica]
MENHRDNITKRLRHYVATSPRSRLLLSRIYKVRTSRLCVETMGGVCGSHWASGSSADLKLILFNAQPHAANSKRYIIKRYRYYRFRSSLNRRGAEAGRQRYTMRSSDRIPQAPKRNSESVGVHQHGHRSFGCVPRPPAPAHIRRGSGLVVSQSRVVVGSCLRWR